MVRMLLLTETSIVVLREVMKLFILLLHALRDRTHPDKYKFFCVSSPFGPFLALICSGLRPMFMFRPGLGDIAWQIVYDGLLQDVPQLALQLLFAKTVARNSLSWFQLCSQLLSAAGMSIMCLRTVNFCLWRRTKFRNVVLPEERRQSCQESNIVSHAWQVRDTPSHDQTQPLGLTFIPDGALPAPQPLSSTSQPDLHPVSLHDPSEIPKPSPPPCSGSPRVYHLLVSDELEVESVQNQQRISTG